MVKQTSRRAYAEHILSGNRSAKKWKIYEFIKEKGAVTRNVISKETNIPINIVTGRVNDLLKDGLIEVIGKMDDPITNKQVEILKVKDLK